MAELYAGATKFKGKWVRVMFICRVNPDFKKKGGLETHLTQPCNGRMDIHKLFKGIDKNEMQTVVRNTKDVEIQSILIKIHDEKPTPECKEYRQMNQLLESLDKKHKEKEEEERKEEIIKQKSMLKENLNSFN